MIYDNDTKDDSDNIKKKRKTYFHTKNHNQNFSLDTISSI